MKKHLETLLMIVGVCVFLFALSRADFWGMFLGAGLVIAPLTAGSMFLMYIAIIGIPFGLGVVFALVAKEIFGKGLIVGLTFIAGLVLGGKFVVSDSFGRIFTNDKSNSGAPK